jgi:DNA-binding GntR family transcriptional regulator
MQPQAKRQSDESGNSGGSQAEIAFRTIRDDILEQRLRMGYPVSENDLAERLGKSRTPIREAVQRLAAEGLLERIPRKGTLVVKLPTRSEVRQIYELAEALEGMAAYLAASRHSELDLKPMEAHLKEMEDSSKHHNNDAWVVADENLHMDLRLLCGNDFLIADLERVYGQIHLARLFITHTGLDTDESNREHRRIAEAIQRGDAEEARKLTHAHWRRIRELIVQVIL